ncbi:MAG TPA: glutamate-ammonia-ligase adenylyltransferase [Spirochaetales bacterium]|nr:glutamate-ammonia-ligase adenylyltransferase [Spirochaetales bacterium]
MRYDRLKIMKPSLENLKKLCPEVDELLIEEHLHRLDERYYNAFSIKEICSHLRSLAGLSSENPVQLNLKRGQGEEVECTITAFDYSAEFSLLTGTLGALGLNIIKGDVFTYERTRPGFSGSRRRGYQRHEVISTLKRRRIVDRFSGYLNSPLSLAEWEEKLRRQLQVTTRLLEQGKSGTAELAREQVNELVAASLEALDLEAGSALMPLHIEEDESCADCTRIRVVTEDTPFFLYALSTALALKGIIIERVSIRTVAGRVEDVFDILNAQGKKIDDQPLLNQVKLSVLLTKQFTYFLGRAPDPYAALCRFEQMVDDILRLPEQGKWLELLSNPLIMQDLARLLGASDFLWEDFIRLQYESLLPMLEPHLHGRSFTPSARDLKKRLTRALKGAKTREEEIQCLNEFKDQEIFLLDMDHILTPDMDFRKLALRLSSLAEEIINRAFVLACNHLEENYGTPQTIAGLETGYAVMALGKFGGRDLGYASDIELLLIYGDAGFTSGPQVIGNMEFYEHLVRKVKESIQARREGIFKLDLRLRPYGNAGPLACSLESFCRYYGTGGDAHSLERLALVRLRAIGGDRELGPRIERLRDEILYTARGIDLSELRTLRRRQLKNKTLKGRLNAKFSPGALVDLEYTVQILQVTYGAGNPEVRTPYLLPALKRLHSAGVLAAFEAKRMTESYAFLHKLINSLRMLRGSSEDLFLPLLESQEYAHLARRMGYKLSPALSPGQQLHLDFETHTAFIRTFVEKHLGRESLPGLASGNIVDLILSEHLPGPLKYKILKNLGMEEMERAVVNLKKLAGRGRQREHFVKLAVLAGDILKALPDPGMALNNWERFVVSLGRADKHYRMLLSQPKGLEILLSILAGSQFLADTLIGNPEFLSWLAIPGNLQNVRKQEDIERELCTFESDWLNNMRRLRRREILRIAARDICLGAPIQEIILELSRLAEAVIRATLAGIQDQAGIKGVPLNFCILALGKLGGSELNYSSDVDLLGIYGEPVSAGSAELCGRIMEKLKRELSIHTEEGYAYRVDLRLRPYGSSGELVQSDKALLDYYRNSASLWERQALLKIRPVAGNLELGYEVVDKAHSLLLEGREKRQIIEAIDAVRSRTIKSLGYRPSNSLNVKLGAGGIRDIEFLVQGLQLIYASRIKDRKLLEGNTLNALKILMAAGYLPVEAAAQLSRDYLFLRRVEHSLQLFEDRQVHTLPVDPSELRALARRIMGVRVKIDVFLIELKDCLERVRRAYTTYLN